MVMVLAFDVETTGLITSRLKRINFQPYVIQFCGALVDCDAGLIVRHFDTFVSPPDLETITADVTKISRITKETVKDHGTFAAYFDKISAMIREAPAVAAHNLVFDRDMLDLEARRIDKAFVWPSRQICTVEMTNHVMGYRLNMADLHRYLLGEDFTDAHDARADVAALVRCLIEMRRREWL
jgi:DNA polymerase III alpha subunit (gram-positive type)